MAKQTKVDKNSSSVVHTMSIPHYENGEWKFNVKAAFVIEKIPRFVMLNASS